MHIYVELKLLSGGRFVVAACAAYWEQCWLSNLTAADGKDL